MRPVLAITGGWLLWAGAFAMLYALHGWGCASGMDQRSVGPVTLLQLLLGIVWVSAMAAALIQLLLLRAPAHPAGDVPRRIVAAGWIAALAAILLTGVPITFSGGCA